MKFFLKVLLFFSLLGLIRPASAIAATEAIIKFDSQIMAYQDGSFDVTETIGYDFGTNEKHGIFRDISKVSRVGDLYRLIEITFNQILRDGQKEQFSITDSSEQISVKIGNPNKTITGIHTYAISYKVQNGIGSNYEDHDEIYWNVTGNEWEIPIEKASTSLLTDFDVLPNKAICFTGLGGSREQNCSVPSSAPFSPVVTTRTLKSGEGLTVVYSFPVNTFPKSILSKNPPQQKILEKSVTQVISKLFVGIPLVGNLILAPGLLFWYLTKKHKKHFGPPVPNFDFPEDEKGKRLAPAEAGTIDAAKLEKDDVVATIFDLAIRKYIKLEQIKESKEFFIKKIKNYDDVAPFEKILLDRLFRDLEVVELGSLKKDFYKTFQDMDREVFNSLVEKKYYTKNPKTQRGLFLAGTIIAATSFNLFLAAVLFLFYKKLIGRTALGDRVDWKIDGLKLFLKNMSRNYKWQAEKLYIVEKMIPYAIALGYIEKFMEQLKISYPDYKPDWYSGNLAFYAVSNSMFTSMSSGFTTSAPSSSGGFGGGGFSGGGGGGGGGGSW